MSMILKMSSFCCACAPPGLCISKDVRFYPHNPGPNCTEKYLSATIESKGCKQSDVCKQIIITEYLGTDTQNDEFLTRVLETAIVMRIDPDYRFTYSGSVNITTYTVTLGGTPLVVSINDVTATYGGAPIVLDSNLTGSFTHNNDTYTIKLFSTYFTLTSANSGLIFNSMTNIITAS